MMHLAFVSIPAAYKPVRTRAASLCACIKKISLICLRADAASCPLGTANLRSVAGKCPPAFLGHERCRASGCYFQVDPGLGPARRAPEYSVDQAAGTTGPSGRSRTGRDYLGDKWFRQVIHLAYEIFIPIYRTRRECGLCRRRASRVKNRLVVMNSMVPMPRVPHSCGNRLGAAFDSAPPGPAGSVVSE